jgi:nucleotide sugar dehydrogenase
MKTIGVVGNGFVGQAMDVFRPFVEVLMWDIDSQKREPLNLNYEDFVNSCEIIFISVPTPMDNDGECHLGIVKESIQSIRNIDPNKDIVIRSTVIPGVSDSLDVSFMPEFLTESNWRQDFVSCKHWIIGTHSDRIEEKFKNILEDVYNKGDGNIYTKEYTRCLPAEAELVKYIKNVFLSVKVSFFNEIHEYCARKGIDFDKAREASTQDARIGSGHSFVPGPDGSYGFGGTCFPKDSSALLKDIEKIGLNSYIIDAAVKRNNLVDRPEKDWQNDKGRAVVDGEKPECPEGS